MLGASKLANIVINSSFKVRKEDLFHKILPYIHDKTDSLNWNSSVIITDVNSLLGNLVL